jgi:hypothetical protein
LHEAIISASGNRLLMALEITIRTALLAAFRLSSNAGNGAPPTDDSPGEPTGAAESVDPDPGYRHDLGPPRDFLAQEPLERLRCAADRVGALIEQALLHLR